MKPIPGKLPTAEAKCSTASAAEDPIDRYLLVHCTFGRRLFDIKLENTKGHLATFAHLAEAVKKETGIPCEKQRLLFKGVIMDPPDMSGFSTLEELNVRSGDQILVVNSRRVGMDDEDTKKFGDILPKVKDTDKELEKLFFELDRIQRGYVPCRDPSRWLDQIRLRGLALEKHYIRYIQMANNLHFDHRNAVFQARRRELIDTCQRQMDKIQELTSAIFDRLALSHASVGGLPILKVAVRDGPCPRLEKVYDAGLPTNLSH